MKMSKWQIILQDDEQMACKTKENDLTFKITTKTTK